MSRLARALRVHNVNRQQPRRAVILLLVSCAAASGLRAQVRGRWPHRAWISGGVGITSHAPVFTAAANYSLGPALVVGRMDAVGGRVGNQIGDRGLGVGVRTPRRSPVGLVAVGVASARSFHSSEGSGTQTYPTATALSFEVSAMFGPVSESGLSVHGLIGPRRVRYTALSYTLSFGRFGDE